MWEAQEAVRTAGREPCKGYAAVRSITVGARMIIYSIKQVSLSLAIQESESSSLLSLMARLCQFLASISHPG